MIWLHKILVIVQVLSAVTMIGLILVQHGKGADMGAAFGSGSSGSLFGASGGANFLSRSTAVLATLFFASTLGLAFVSNVSPSPKGSVLEKTPITAPVSSGTSLPPGQPAPASGSPAPGDNAGGVVNQIPSK